MSAREMQVAAGAHLERPSSYFGISDKALRSHASKLAEIYLAYLGEWASVPIRAGCGERDLAELAPDELEMLALVDGERTVQQIVDASGLTPPVALAILTELVRSERVTSSH